MENQEFTVASKSRKFQLISNFFKQKSNSISLIIVALAVIFFSVSAALNNLSEMRFRSNASNTSNRLITFRGSAEVAAIPDLATFNFTVRETQKDAAAAQQKMTEKTNNLIAALAEVGIAKNDIQTSNYSTFPKYNYVAQPCVKGVCPPSTQVLEGYEATQTLTVKLRDNAKTGEILTKAAALQITEVFGPNFSVEDPTKYKLQAQAEAINKAKSEAEITAKNLGVKLGKIVRFQEEPFHNFSGRPMLMKGAMTADSSFENAAPRLEAGEEKISISVSITYEIE